jgi:hypothetical protein
MLNSVECQTNKTISEILFADTGYRSTVHVAAVFSKLLGPGVQPALAQSALVRSRKFRPIHHRSLLSPFSGPACLAPCTIGPGIEILS